MGDEEELGTEQAADGLIGGGAALSSGAVGGVTDVEEGVDTQGGVHRRAEAGGAGALTFGSLHAVLRVDANEWVDEGMRAVM